MEPTTWIDGLSLFGDMQSEAAPASSQSGLHDRDANQEQQTRPAKQLACLSCRRKKVKVRHMFDPEETEMCGMAELFSVDLVLEERPSVIFA